MFSLLSGRSVEIAVLCYACLRSAVVAWLQVCQCYAKDNNTLPAHSGRRHPEMGWPPGHLSSEQVIR